MSKFIKSLIIINGLLLPIVLLSILYQSTKHFFRDKNYKNAAYMIGFEDTNQDGKLSSEDLHDVYISDLSGKNLTQVSKGVDVVDFEFTEGYSRINLRYKERTGEKDEHRNIKFAVFDISTNTWSEQADLNKALLEVEKMMLE